MPPRSGTPTLRSVWIANGRRVTDGAAAVNWLDLAIIVTILWFTFSGLTTGLLREGVTMLAAFVGVVLAGRFYQRLAEDIRIVHDDILVDRLIAFVAIFAATLLAGQVVGTVLRQAASLLMLGSFDRFAGLVFGFVKGCVIVELVLVAFTVFPAASWMASAIDSSLVAPLFLNGAPWLLHLLPGTFRERVHVV